VLRLAKLRKEVGCEICARGVPIVFSCVSTMSRLTESSVIGCKLSARTTRRAFAIGGRICAISFLASKPVFDRKL
jgi:hypothetical protein